MRNKVTGTLLVVTVILFALLVYVAVIMQGNGDEYQRMILAQQGYSTTTLPFRRGSILDRNYNVLAYSEEVYNLILDPSIILYPYTAKNPENISPNRQCTVDALVTVYGFDRNELESILSEQMQRAQNGESVSAYVRYAMRLSAREKEYFENYQETYNTARDESGWKLHQDRVTGVWFEKEYKREYPNNNLACTVLGFSGNDSTMGNWGIEQYYNDLMVGTNGKSYSYINADGYHQTDLAAAVNGQTVVTTIDYTIQNIVEREIAKYKETEVYKDVGVIVMNPNNGEILAMATDKTYDLNNPQDLSSLYTEAEVEAMTTEELGNARNLMWRNFSISDTYIPGSVSKELTVAMALEEHVATPDTILICDGGETILDAHINCIAKHGAITLSRALAVSCNDAMMNLASRVSAETMVKYFTAFGMGSRTGIDLPGEAAGQYYSATGMTPVDMATSSFGYGYSSTMIQMIAIYGAMVNGGYYYQPHLVREILDENGGLIREIQPTLIKHVLTEDTSVFLRQAAYETVMTGSAWLARIDGYTVGGKTGTAQQYPLEDNKYVISFMGFAPVDSPQLLVYVVVNECAVDEEGNASNTPAVQLEQTIMTQILPYLGIPRK